jgi:hypothetical protein
VVAPLGTVVLIVEPPESTVKVAGVPLKVTLVDALVGVILKTVPQPAPILQLLA